jgi:hypothetical protein
MDLLRHVGEVRAGRGAHGKRLLAASPRVTAGLRWAPEMWPGPATAMARARPGQVPLKLVAVQEHDRAAASSPLP